MNLKIKKVSGITLIALIITIIVLLILAGVTITTLTGENGVLKRGTQAVINHKKAQYYEEIKIEIYEEQIERAAKIKEDPFITSLNSRIIKKEWVSKTTKCDEYFEEKVNDYENTIIFIETTDGYQIIIDVNNKMLNAVIREDSFSAIGDKCKVEYNANGGTGNVDTQEIINGFYAVLENNSYSKTNYSFVGWCKDKDGNDEIYAEGSRLKVEGNVVLYAIWKKETATISFESNGGTGTMESITIARETNTTLPTNTFIKDGYYFVQWNTKADGTGTNYTTSITTSEDITLYAQWKIYYTITFNANGGTGTMSKIQVKQGASTTLISNQFTRNGYDFFRWNTSSDGKGTPYSNGGSLTANDNMTLYAQWASQTNTTTYDGYGNKIVIPAGFIIVAGTYVTEGIVIQDLSGNQFVWVPVGYVCTNTSKTNYIGVDLSRYDFGTSGTTRTLKGASAILDKETPSITCQELTTAKYTNQTIAKSISKFSTSATNNAGYYIGRYEAGDGVRTSSRSSSSSETNKMVCQYNKIAYNYITQANAAKLARNMYTSTNYTSDLINSYAWDTAIRFIELFGTNSDYAHKRRTKSSLLKTGVTGEKQCNIYDMAGNLREYTTESCTSCTYNTNPGRVIVRGAAYNTSNNYTSLRFNLDAGSKIYVDGFRPILYIN